MRTDIVGLSMRPREGTLKMGASVQLNLLAETSSGGTDLVPGTMATWSSSDDGIAEVNRQGRLTPRGAGAATITATYAENKATGSFTVVD